MYKPHLIIALALFVGSAQLFHAQTPNPRDPQVSPDNASRTSRTTTPQNRTSQSYSKEELKRRSQEAKRFYDLGQKFGGANLFRQAAEVFQKSIDLKPDYADAYFGLVTLTTIWGRWQEAILALEKVIELNPKDKEAFKFLHAAEAKLREQEASSTKTETSSAIGVPRCCQGKGFS